MATERSAFWVATTHLGQRCNTVNQLAARLNAHPEDWEQGSKDLITGLNQLEDAIAAIRRHWPKPQDTDGNHS